MLTFLQHIGLRPCFMDLERIGRCDAEMVDFSAFFNVSPTQLSDTATNCPRCLVEDAGTLVGFRLP